MNDHNNDKNSKEKFDGNDDEIRESDFDTFFADLDNIEEEISSEAYELVVHALSLIEGHYYDDAVEVLRQAIGLYSQINKNAEIEALNKKISDIYVLKEEYFREAETETIIDVIEKEEDKKEIFNKAYEIIEKGKEFMNMEKFEEALDKYDEAIEVFQKINNNDEIERVNILIEKCYNKKAEYLRRSKKESVSIQESIKTKAQTELSEEQLKQQRIIAFEEAKKREEEISSKAFEILGKASELAEIHQYDQAINLYLRGATLFEDISWSNESKKVRNTIEQLEKQKAKFNADMEIRRGQEEKMLEDQKAAEMIEKAQIEEQIRLQAQAEKIADIEKRKIEEELFKTQITEMIDNAEKLAREYDLAMKKAIKKGYLLENCVYPEVIAIYEGVKKKIEEKGWIDQAKIYTNQIKHYEDLLVKDRKLRQVEAQKLEKQKQYEELHKLQKEEKISGLDIDRLKLIEEQRRLEGEEEDFRRVVDKMISNAERIAREYELEMKKAIKRGYLLENCIYPEVIAIYEEVKEKVAEKGWTDQVEIYNKQIRHYYDLLEKDEKLRQIEAQKLEKQRQYEDLQKMKKGERIADSELERLKILEEQRRLEGEEEEFRRVVDKIVNNTEKLAREYDIRFKKGIKKGNLNFESKYPEIIENYTQARNLVLEKGLDREGAIYSNQIRKYSDLFEKEKKVRELEVQKAKKQLEFEEMKRIKKEGEILGTDIQKIKYIEAKKKLEQAEGILETEIDQMIDVAEKEAREYELAIKRGKFEKDCPFPKIIEIYKDIREKVYAKGWTEEAKLYTNQIILYQEKLKKDKNLRELEAEKVRKEQEFKESFKKPKGVKLPIRAKLEEIEKRDTEDEKLLDEAMILINEAENEVKSYELSLKKDILIYQSPYDKAISNYEKARNLFNQVGWTEEAHRLLNTINFYKGKKARDDNLRDIEKQKLEKVKLEKARAKYIPEQVPFAREQKIMDLEKFKKEKTKDTEAIFNLINIAERLAQEYEVKKKDGILNIDSPFQEIINIYKDAKERFVAIGWNEQAGQLADSINYYKEKLGADNRLRALETQKLEEEKKKETKRKLDAQLAREAEAKLLEQKTQALELKRKQALEYEAKKEQAFNFMDLAKKEMKHNNFEKAIRFYKDSEKIFDEINWQEGIRMVNESIKVIKKKEEAIEREKKILRQKEEEKLKMEAQLEEQITKAQDLKDLQEQKRKKEILAIQKQQEYEKGVSEQAYRLLEDGTALKNIKKFEEAYEKYIMGRNLFEKIGWVHEVSRINNDLLFILKKEMKQTEKIRAMQKRKLEEEKELEVLLKEAEEKRKELEKVKKEEKRKQRELIIQEKLDEANNIIKDLKYNEAILKFKKIIRKLEKFGQKKQIKQINKQIDVLVNASQVPLITRDDVESNENVDKFKIAYEALDRAQISLSGNQFMKAISELNEAKFNLKETIIGTKYIPIIKEKVNAFKKELGIKVEVEEKVKIEKAEDEEDSLRIKIAARRAERRKRVKDLLEKKE
ncbi:MAG: hypothetical protein ACFFDL_02410 [Promethearchaeota archaeon]